MKSIKKVIALVLVAAMIPLGGIVFASKNEAENASKAGWTIEAESAAIVSNAQAFADDGAIERGALEILGANTSGAADAKISVSVPENGDYYLHIRAKSIDGSGKTVGMAVDSGAAESFLVSAKDYAWTSANNANTLDAGEHEINIFGASEGVYIDEVLLSKFKDIASNVNIKKTAAESKAAYAPKQELPSVYPKIFDDNAYGCAPKFEKNDRVLFFGDSITHSVGHTFQYHTWILSYYATRYPESRFTYINAGRSGDTASAALIRLNSDININDYNKVVLMIGTNDVNRSTYNSHRDDKAACDAVIETYIKNIDTLQKKLTENGAELILMGPTYWNEFTSQSASSPEIIEGYNNEIRRVNNYLKDYAYDKGICYVDLNTPLTKAMLYNTRKNSSYLTLFNSADRTHPNEAGHYIMAYSFLKSQGESGLVASADIDAQNKTASATNAQVSNISADNSTISFTYKPKSLPLAADTYLRQTEQVIAINDELNREIIKVSGLQDGSYSIKMNSNTVMENVSSDELSEGVNIADAQNNPNQQQALLVKGIINLRSEIEKKKIRDFRQTEYSAITTKNNGLTADMTYDELIAKASSVPALASYVAAKKDLYNYYGAVNYFEKLIYSVNKPLECSVTIERTGEKDASAAQNASYTLEEVALNEGAEEIRFDKDVSSESDFTVDNGTLTAYSGSAKNVYIPSGVTKISANAFANGSHIEYLYVPSSVSEIEDGSFKNLSGAKIYISKTLFTNESASYKKENGALYKSDGGLLYCLNADENAEFEVPYGVSKIASYAFAGKTSLNKVTIYDSVSEIGEGAFENTNITIRCYPDSAAYNYAVSNQIPYELMNYSDNADLSELKFNGTSVFNFNADKTAYNIDLFAACDSVDVTAKALEENMGASVEIINNGAKPSCEITVRVTAQDKTTTKDYVLYFNLKQDAISNFTTASKLATRLYALRLDGEYSTYQNFNKNENNQFILTSSNTSEKFGYGVIIQRNKGDASSVTYTMPFYSNNGSPLLGAKDGNYWISFDISEPATVYVGILEGKVWTNATANGWTTDDEGLKFYNLSGTKLYKKHFNAGTVNIPSFGTHSTYESKKTERVEWNPSAYAVLFDSSFDDGSGETAEFAVTEAQIGSTKMAENKQEAPKLSKDDAYNETIFVSGSAPSGEGVSLIITPENDENTIIAIDETIASKSGKFSFETLAGEDIKAGVLYQMSITTTSGDKKNFYFETTEEKHDVSVVLNPEVKKYMSGYECGESMYKYADDTLGEIQTIKGATFHVTETVNGIVKSKKENGKFVMETRNGEVGVQFSSERGLHRAGQIGIAFKGLNHVLVNQNISPGRMTGALKDKTLTWEGESITLNELSAKYKTFFAGKNVLYSVTVDDNATAYVALPYECPAYTEEGWSVMVMGNDDIPTGYGDWNCIPESTYFSAKYPYKLVKYQHDSPQINIAPYNYIYYKSVSKGETFDVYTGGKNYAQSSNEVPKTIIRWGEHLRIDTDFDLTYNGESKNILSDSAIYTADDKVTLSASSSKGASVTLSKTEITEFPTVVTAFVTAAAGNSAEYKITVDQKKASTKIKEVSYTIDGISESFDLDNADFSAGNEFSFTLPSANVKSKMKKGISSVKVSVTAEDKYGSMTMYPADGVLDFSQNGKADLSVTVTDNLGSSKNYILHFGVPVYDLESISDTATVRKLFAEDQISAYDGYSAGELKGFETTGKAATAAIKASSFEKEAFVIARSKADASSATATMPFYGGATYNSDETGWWLTFKVTGDSYVYVIDREGWGWKNKDASYWLKDNNINIAGVGKTYYHFAKAGETVKIPNYGYDESWAPNGGCDASRKTKDPSYYIVVPAEAVKGAALSLTTNGGAVTALANEVTYNCTDSLTQQIAAGSAVTLTAADENNFMYWQDAVSKRILSYEKTYEFMLGSDREIIAMHKDDTQDSYYVMFTDANGKLLGGGYSTDTDLLVPKNPYMQGYSFAGWYDGGEKISAAEGKKVSDLNITKDTQYKAGYKEEKIKRDVYVNGELYGSYSYNETVTLTAPAQKDGQTFIYWKRDGQTASYNSEYSFKMGIANTSAEAVYDDNAVDKDVVIIMNEPVVLSGLNRISFMAERDIPSEYTLVESGIILSKTENISLGSQNIIKSVSTSKEHKGQFTIRKAGLSAGDKWYAKAYVIYKNAYTTYTSYSNEVSAVYAD